MAAVTIWSDFGAQENKIYHCFHFSLFDLSWSVRTSCHNLSFFNIEFQANFFTLLFSPSSRGSLVPAIRVLSSAFLRLLIFLLAILIPSCASSSSAFCMRYSEYKLNKQGDNIQPWHSPYPIWNQSIAPCLALTIASWLTYRFLRRQVILSGIPIIWRIFQFVVIYRVKVDVFLKFLFLLHDPRNVGDLISGSSGSLKLVHLEVLSSHTAET